MYEFEYNFNNIQYKLYNKREEVCHGIRLFYFRE